ncbi:MAG: S1 RNA-binding domain-containing protein, partial [Ilumatobacteraceae bacterium]
GHQVDQLVYGRVTKLVQFGAFVQVGEGIEGLVHISEMSAHHVDSPEQVVTPGEELWVKIIDLDLARRRISLSIKQAAEGGELAAEYREHFEVDSAGNWIQGEASAEAEAAWSEYYGEGGEGAAEGATQAASETVEVVESTDEAGDEVVEVVEVVEDVVTEEAPSE